MYHAFDTIIKNLVSVQEAISSAKLRQAGILVTSN